MTAIVHSLSSYLSAGQSIVKQASFGALVRVQVKAVYTRISATALLQAIVLTAIGYSTYCATFESYRPRQEVTSSSAGELRT